MGHKKVCYTCRKAFSVYKDMAIEINLTCPECGGQTTLISHRFRPPKQHDQKKWKVAEFLKNNGFNYDHISEETAAGKYMYVHYPETMREAIAFVQKHRKVE